MNRMDDLISRQAAIDAIERLILPQTKGETAAEEINRVAWRCAINCAEEMIGHLSSAERHGRWEYVEPAPHNLFYATCSVCGDRQTIEVANYCPNCGAKMDEEDQPKRFWPEQVEKIMIEAIAKAVTHKDTEEDPDDKTL